MLLSPEALGLLRTATRARPSTRGELLALADLGEDRASQAVEELVGAGFLVLRGNRVEVVPLAHAVSTRVEQVLADRSSRIEAEHAAVRTGLDQLGELMRDLGSGTGQDPLVAELVHGPMAPRDAAARLYSRNPSLASWCLVPDATRLDVPAPEIADFLEVLGDRSPERDRILLGPVETGTGLRDNLATVLDSGVDIRVHHHLPSWCAINSDDSLVLPVEWGSPWPTSVMVVRHPGLAGAVRELFLTLWAQGQPLLAPSEDEAWRPLVRLLATGATLEAAARTLDISARTARRRLSEAMRHYRVRTPVELGVVLGRAGHQPGAGAVSRSAGLSGSGR